MGKYFEEAHRFCSRNRKHLEKDVICGCFYCLEIFHPEKLQSGGMMITQQFVRIVGLTLL